MSDKQRCKATITVEKRGNQGEPCKLWAQHGTDFCNRHQGGEGAGTPGTPERLEHRCIARSSRTGSQCKRPALRGMRVCRNHGGATKASQAKARDLLDRMVEPVLWELRNIALSPDTSESDRLRAITMVLDRTLPKEAKVEVEVKPWEITMQHVFNGMDGKPILQREPSPEHLAELTSAMPAFDPSEFDIDYDDIEEAELVEEEDIDPRDYLPRIRPARSMDSRATYEPPRRVGSAEPPRARKDLDE